MVVCATSHAKTELVACEELKIKDQKCLVIVPESKEVKLKLTLRKLEISRSTRTIR